METMSRALPMRCHHVVIDSTGAGAKRCIVGHNLGHRLVVATGGDLGEQDAPVFAAAMKVFAAAMKDAR